jgi:very-short-patch-repair endonuclease
VLQHLRNSPGQSAPPGQEEDQSHEIDPGVVDLSRTTLPPCLHNQPRLKAIRRHLRNHQTVAEAMLWNALKSQGLGWKFRRQHSVGPYVLDFYCPVLKLGIEVDGAIHDDAVVAESNADRTRWLHEQGVTLIRLRNEQIIRDLQATRDWLRQQLAGRSSTTPDPSCPGGALGDRTEPSSTTSDLSCPGGALGDGIEPSSTTPGLSCPGEVFGAVNF